jgi:chromate reductase, NAD(P)H dehydrogenase (quinone)
MRACHYACDAKKPPPSLLPTRSRVEIAVLSGSLQERSSNAALVRAAVRVAPEGQRLRVFGALGEVPLLNPELDGEQPPPAVAALRASFQAADGVLIATPEYGHSVPGVLKNALDWLVASGELSGMPVAILSASTTHTGAFAARWR